MDYARNHGGAPSAPYQPLYNQQPPPAYSPANATMPAQYQPNYAPYGVVPSQGPVIQLPQHTTIVVPVQPPYAPDYMGYSIFTMLCCCLPLGIAALIYSIWTQDANRVGNGAEAQQNSRMARILAHSALVVGLLLSTTVGVVVYHYHK